MTQIAIVVYPGFTALDFIGPYEVLRNLPDAEVRFVWHGDPSPPTPVCCSSGPLIRSTRRRRPTFFWCPAA
jgi:putative intracellular protease/amidase